MSINAQKLDDIMTELGHPESLNGTLYLRTAVETYRPGMAITKELYPAIAKAHDTTPARAERCMRHSIETAWARGSDLGQLKWFGYTIDPGRGCPTVSEYVARLAKLCHEAVSL